MLNRVYGALGTLHAKRNQPQEDVVEPVVEEIVEDVQPEVLTDLRLDTKTYTPATKKIVWMNDPEEEEEDE
jgi:hypothetical protein